MVLDEGIARHLGTSRIKLRKPLSQARLTKNSKNRGGATLATSLPLRSGTGKPHFTWPPLLVNLPIMNSCARLAPMRSAVPIAKFPNTKPAPRFDRG